MPPEQQTDHHWRGRDHHAAQQDTEACFCQRGQEDRPCLQPGHRNEGGETERRHQADRAVGIPPNSGSGVRRCPTSSAVKSTPTLELSEICMPPTETVSRTPTKPPRKIASPNVAKSVSAAGAITGPIRDATLLTTVSGPTTCRMSPRSSVIRGANGISTPPRLIARK